MYVTWIVFLLATLLCKQSHVFARETSVLDNETNENSVIAQKSEKEDRGLIIESIEYKSHIPTVENSLDDDDIMANAVPAVTVATAKPTDAFESEDLMMRTKREAKPSPSFDDIFNFLSDSKTSSSKGGTVSNELRSELSAKAASTNSDNMPSRNRRNSPDGMRSIMDELKASKHHKMTRNDLRQLAKKAVILATLKKLKEKPATSSPTQRFAVKTPSSSAGSKGKPLEKISSIKSSKKHKKTKRGKKKHKAEKHAHVSSTVSATTTNKVVTVSGKENEMSEDLSSHTSKKGLETLSDDENIQKGNKNAISDDIDGDSVDLMPSTNSDVMAKKSTIGKIDESVANIFDDSESSPTDKMTTSTSGSQLAQKVKSLRSFLVTADPRAIPVKFLPDLPSGLRMIGWKEMIDKKKKQLSELEATVGSVDDATETKPVSLNIDVEDPITGKASAADSAGDLTELTGDKKSADPISLQHIGYLQRHIKGARSLRKLIAKTLVGHCKSTGKRIFEAFVAMDKALARAQTIATVIGKKFNIDIDRIDALVGDKEDQVVETFLKDIFTKI